MEVGEAAAEILIVDDDPDCREGLAMLLEEEGRRVATAADGCAALEYLRSHGKPNLILLDLMMPVMDGWQFRSAQQQDPELAGVPVAVLSAASESLARSGTLGAVAYFSKPFDFTRLFQIIDRYCARG